MQQPANKPADTATRMEDAVTKDFPLTNERKQDEAENKTTCGGFTESERKASVWDSKFALKCNDEE